MPVSELLQMVRSGDLAAFEKTCLAGLEAGTLQLGQLVDPFQELQKKADASQIAGLSELVLENVDVESQPAAALAIGRIALLADADNVTLRARLADLYRRVYGRTPGAERLIEASGLLAGRPARNALRMLDVCFALRPGDALVSRSEGTCVEVIEPDLEHGLVTLRSEGRPRNVTTLELTREYELADANDFRVQRQLHPDRLKSRIQSEPDRVVVDLIRLHGGMIDQEQLKHELTPRFVEAAAWSKWWSSVRAQLKRDPHVQIEGRSPVILKYTQDARTFEDETWEQFEAQNESHDWLATLESYVREKKKHREEPDAALLTRMHEFVTRKARAAADRRPGEALACSLVSDFIHSVHPVAPEDARNLAHGCLMNASDPAELLATLPSASLWEIALNALVAARPKDAAAFAAEALPDAPSAAIDQILTIAVDGGLTAAVQAHVDTAVADPVDHPELVYWLWRSPETREPLKLPPKREMFATIIETLSALGRTLTPAAAKMKQFRLRMRAALALQDYATVRRCVEQVDAHRAVTLRTQLNRLEGLGDTARAKLLDILRDVHPAMWKVHRKEVPAWSDPDVFWTTRAGLDRKINERDHLVNVTMRENAKRIGEAAAMGDLSENSEYKFALEERDLLRARLAQMNHEISLSEPIVPADVPTDRVGVGSRALLRDCRTGAEVVFTFLGPFDGDVERNIYNYRAPFSQKLMGLAVGERAKVTLDSTEFEYEVIEIQNGLA